MTVPNLDDRTFLDLVADARDRIAHSCPTWTDLSVHDPGMALVEAFAYLTEVLIYRVNQMPEKAYIAFLNMLGVSRHPPAAAWAEVTFTRMNNAQTNPVAIPSGTRIAAARGADPQPAVFVTTEPTVLPADATEVTVRAHHCELVEGELLGVGTGQPGLKLTAARVPIVTTTEALDLLLGVEVPTGTLAVGAAAREHEGKTYEIWRPVVSFAGSGPESKIYQIDRASGVVTFAPALDLRGPAAGEPGGTEQPVALAAVPPAGRQIRLWYRVGGGPAGNVAAETLTSLRDPLPGLRVTNRKPARGGRALETVESAIARGPYEFFSLHRAVTARDFETLATAGSAAVTRARAFTRAAVLSFARPGEVADPGGSQPPAGTRYQLHRDVGPVQGGLGAGQGRGAPRGGHRGGAPPDPRPAVPDDQSTADRGQHRRLDLRRAAAGVERVPRAGAGRARGPLRGGRPVHRGGGTRLAHPHGRRRRVPAGHLVRRQRRGAVPIHQRGTGLGAGRPLPRRGDPAGRPRAGGRPRRHRPPTRRRRPHDETGRRAGLAGVRVDGPRRHLAAVGGARATGHRPGVDRP